MQEKGGKMKNSFLKRLIAGIMTIMISLSYIKMFPISSVIVTAENDVQKSNEEMYSSVLNNYIENVIPGNIDLFDENSQTWKYSDEWNFASNDPSKYGYKFYDLDGDGIDELFIIGLEGSYMDKVHVREIYTMYNGSVKPIAIGGARWNYYVLEGENILCKEGANSASEMGYTFYHLKDGELIAFEKYINNAGTWYYADGENCEESYYNSMQVISKDEVYSAHSNTMGGIENPIFNEETYNFINYTNHQCGENAYWNMNESTATLTIHGNGTMYDYNNACPIYSYTSQTDPPYSTKHFTSIVINNGITSVGNKAFFGSYENVIDIQLPESLEYIGNQAFYFVADSVPTSIIIPKTVTYIGEKAIGYHEYNTSDGNNNLISIEETVPDFIIYGYEGTIAETYANENNLQFISLDDSTFEYNDILYEKYFIKQHFTNYFEENDIWYHSYEETDSSNPFNKTIGLMNFDMKHGALRSNIMLDLEKSVFDLNVAELFSNPIDTKSVYFTLLSRFVSESYSEEELTEIMAKSLLDTLTDINTKLNEFVTEKFNDSVTEIGIIDSLNSIADIYDEINQSTKFAELTKCLNKAGDTFNALGIANNIIQGTFEGYTNIKDYLEYTTYYKMFATLDNSIHETFCLIKDNTDDEELIAVLNEYIGVLESEDKDEYIKQLCTLNINDITGEEIKKTILAIVGDIVNGYIVKVASKIPYVNIVVAVWVGARAIVTAENLVVDKIMNTDEYYEKFATIVACNVIHRALYEGYNDYIKIFKDNPTIENSNVIHTINTYYMSIDILAIEYAKKYINLFIKNNTILYSAIITAPYFYYKISEILQCDYKDAFSELNKINFDLNNLSEKYSCSSCCMPKEMWELSIIIERYFNETLPEQLNNITYEAIELWNQKKNEVLERWKNNVDVIIISCPVSIKVYDENNQEIAYLSDTETKVNPMYSQFFFTCAETNEQYQSDKTDYLIESTKGKILILPHDDKNYHFEISGTDDGTMNIASYYVNDISSSDWFDSNNINYSFENVSITNKSNFTIEKENDEYSLKQNTLANSVKSFIGDNITKIFIPLAIVTLGIVFLKKRNKK